MSWLTAVKVRLANGGPALCYFGAFVVAHRFSKGKSGTGDLVMLEGFDVTTELRVQVGSPAKRYVPYPSQPRCAVLLPNRKQSK